MQFGTGAVQPYNDSPTPARLPPVTTPIPTPDDAILRTLLYADVFDYPLTLAEIHHYLIATQPAMAPLPPEAIEAALHASPWLAARVTRVNVYVTLRDRESIGRLR